MRVRIKRTVKSIDQRLWDKRRELVDLIIAEENVSFKKALGIINFRLEYNRI